VGVELTTPHRKNKFFYEILQKGSPEVGRGVIPKCEVNFNRVHFVMTAFVV
jgi:hypothetical protein